METQPKLTNSKEVIEYLVKQFPACFIAEGEAKPLKIGIFKDIVERLAGDEHVSKTQLRAALRRYTSSWRYLYGLKVGAERIDLDGKGCGVLEQSHIDFARSQLEQAKLRIKSQRKEMQKRQTPANATKNVISKPPKKKSKSNPAKRFNHNKTESKVRTSSTTMQHKDEKTQLRKLTESELTDLAVGQKTQVKVGNDIISAVILEINKEAIRVQLSSGLSLTLHLEHLVRS